MAQPIPKIISVGGSIIIPKSGFDLAFLKKFRTLIVNRVKRGERFILVVGGGSICREYQTAAKVLQSMTNEDLDWLGIYSTIYNAQFVRFLFKDYAYKEVVTDPTKKITTKAPVIVAGGWKPGWSTDNVAVLLAKTYGAGEVINLSNIEYVYDKDPKQYPEAKPIELIDWSEFRESIVGSIWTPGHSAPFDPIASRAAERQKLKVSILLGTDLTEVGKALGGKRFKGTVIEPK